MLYAYITGKPTQDLVLQNFARGCGAQILHINHYLKNGLPAKCSGVVFAGMLRGNTQLLHEVKNLGLTYYYMDHAYLSGGKYVPPYWMRITKNGFVQTKLVENVDLKRYNRFFHQDFESWKFKKNKKILVLPPTHATQYALGAYSWTQKTMSSLQTLTQGTDYEIEVADKPDQPIINKHTGKIIGRTPKSAKKQDWNAELENVYAVVAFNSNLALTALRKGIPVICTKFCPAHPASVNIKTILNIKTDTINRYELFSSLSMGQYNMYEMRNGWAYNILNNIEQTYDE